MIRIKRKPNSPFVITQFKKSLGTIIVPKRAYLKYQLLENNKHYIFKLYKLEQYIIDFNWRIAYEYEQSISRVCPKNFDTFMAYCVTYQTWGNKEPEALMKSPPTYVHVI